MALTPSLELGVRHDGGDAETGFGVDIGGGLAFADLGRGLSMELNARTLLAHEASGFRERGLTAALSFDPRPSTERGLTLSLRQTLGAASTGGADALLGRETLAGLGASDSSDARRLELTAGYGIAMFGGRFTGTPELGVGLSDTGRDYRLGWRLGLGSSGATSFELGLEATRRESANDNADPEHTAGFRIGREVVGGDGAAPLRHRARRAARVASLRPGDLPEHLADDVDVGGEAGTGRIGGVGREQAQLRRARLVGGLDALDHEPVAVPEHEELAGGGDAPRGVDDETVALAHLGLHRVAAHGVALHGVSSHECVDIAGYFRTEPVINDSRSPYVRPMASLDDQLRDALRAQRSW